MISLDLEQVPVAIHSLSPTAICGISRISEDLASPSNFTQYYGKSEAKHLRTSDDYERSLPRFGDAAYPRVTRCMDVRIYRKGMRGENREKKRNEAKRSDVRTGPNWLVLRAPRMPCGPARGFRYLGLRVGRV